MVLGCLTQLCLQTSAEPLLEALGQSGDKNVTCGFNQACRSSPRTGSWKFGKVRRPLTLQTTSWKEHLSKLHPHPCSPSCPSRGGFS